MPYFITVEKGGDEKERENILGKMLLVYVKDTVS